MTIDVLKSKLKNLRRTNPRIHISVNFQSPKLVLDNAPATITGVYNHILQVEETTAGIARSHSLQLSDIMVGRVKIRELE